MKMRANRSASFGLKANRIAPIVSILVFVIGWFLVDTPFKNDQSILSHRARIAEKMDSFPYQLSDWMGTDVPIPTAAIDILNPNSLVSRRYTRLNSNDNVVMALIHCSDTRDMQGHYPPVCYPARGWNLEEGDIENIPMVLGDTDVVMRLYRFKRFDRTGLEQKQIVLSMFLLPDGLMTTDMEDLKEISSRGRNPSSSGVAQLQMVFNATLDQKTVLEQAGSLMSAVPDDLIKALQAPIYADASSQLTEGEQR